MYTIVNKNTFFPNVSNEHENNSCQGKNGKLRKVSVTNGGENGQVVVTAVSCSHVNVKLKLSIASFLHVTRIRKIRKIFELPKFETVRFGRNTTKYMGPLIWSKLPRHLRMTETLNSFKGTLEKLTFQLL